jgi:hypothetical protein
MLFFQQERIIVYHPLGQLFNSIGQPPTWTTRRYQGTEPGWKGLIDSDRQGKFDLIMAGVRDI